MHLLNHLDQSVTGGHDWESFLSTVIVWRSAWPSRCDILGTAPYRNGTILHCVPQFIPRTFTLLERWSNDHNELPYTESEEFLEVMSMDWRAGVWPVEEGGGSSSSGPAVPEDVEEREPAKKLVAPTAPTATDREEHMVGLAQPLCQRKVQTSMWLLNSRTM